MPILANAKSLYRNLFRTQRVEQELDEEIRSHLALLVDDKISEGKTPEEAARIARLELGGIEQVKECVRDARVGIWLGTLLQDVRFGLRMLRKNPGFTTIAVLTLALGIGATAAIFTVVDAVLIRPLPFSNPSRLVMIWEGFPQMGFSKFGFSAPDLAFFERAQKSFADIGAFQNEEFDISGNGQQPERVTSARISASVLPMIGAEPILGRPFAREDDAPGHNVALLSYGFWQRRFEAIRASLGEACSSIDRHTQSLA